MAGMTDEQIIEARTWVGSAPVDSVLDDNYDRLGTVRAVAKEILLIRRADLIRTPTSFSIAGEYSQSTGGKQGTIDYIEKLLAEIDTAAFISDGDIGSAQVKRLVREYDPLPGR